jgi:cytochrome oxidase Cu insertion factor (SCO1/SenC/PrrC family)
MMRWLWRGDPAAPISAAMDQQTSETPDQSPGQTKVSPAAKRGVIVFVVGLAVLIGGLVFEYLYLAPRTGSGGIELGAGSLAIGGPFTLVDQNGATRRPEDFRGKLMLIYFGYTYCPDVCPTELQTMSEALAQLGDKAAAVQPLFITVDPERDTPEQMKSYAENFDPSLLALTGSAAQVAEAAKAYRVFYEKAKQPDGSYAMDHSSIVYLMGGDGKYLAHFGPGTNAADMAAAIAKRL